MKTNAVEPDSRAAKALFTGTPVNLNGLAGAAEQRRTSLDIRDDASNHALPTKTRHPGQEVAHSAGILRGSNRGATAATYEY
jgi:hypothetical protein